MDMIKSSSIDRDLCSLVARPRVLHHLVRREHVIPDLLPEGGLYLVAWFEKIDMHGYSGLKSRVVRRRSEIDDSFNHLLSH